MEDRYDRIIVKDLDWTNRNQRLRVDLRMRGTGDYYTSCGIRVMRPGQYPGEEDEWFATPAGIGIPIRLLPPLIKALERAWHLAREARAREQAQAAPEPVESEGEATIQ